MCYSNPTIVNMYTYYCKLVYKIIVNGDGYKITYFIVSYRVYSPYILAGVVTPVFNKPCYVCVHTNLSV